MARRSKKALQQNPRLRSTPQVKLSKAQRQRQLTYGPITKWRKCSDNPKYMSRAHQEYHIERDETGYWVIKIHAGGWLTPALKGNFTSFKMAEDTLIRQLKKTDKWNKAIYPGCLAQQPKSSTERLSED